MRDHENENHIVDIIINCGAYEISDEALGRAIETFHKGQITQTEGNKLLVKE